MATPTEGSPSQSPNQGPQTPLNESDLPKGQCRYILLVPEIKGQRCACANFTLSKAMPSALCDCGHLACFHLKADEAVSTADKHEVELLRQRVQSLEQQLDRDTSGGYGGVVGRLSEVEERLDKARDESRGEIKGLYSSIDQAWASMERLENGAKSNANMLLSRMQAAERRILAVENRQMEQTDFEDVVDERLELLEGVMDLDGQAMALRGRPRRKSTSDSTPRANGATTNLRRQCSATPATDMFDAAPLPFRAPPTLKCPWTVHVSFLPDARQPFPFEKDTTAYKRCLSRGLHRMVVVANATADAFTDAIEHAFGPLLQQRLWMPLEAKLCDLKTLQGLPMLRPLDEKLQAARYDSQFLRQHCAVCDAGGKMESLYIAMRSDTLSWHFLRRSPVFLEGLEECWQHDSMLDPPDVFCHDDRNRPSAADVTELPLKRAASAATLNSDAEGPRKMPKTTCITMVDVPRRVERV